MIDQAGCVKLPVNRIHMELTNVCNFSCEFCPDSKMKRQRGVMSLEMAKSILDEIGTHKLAKTVLFHVMGEPTLHPDLIEIVRYANTKKIETCLTTNGSRMDDKLMTGLIDAGLGRIIISLQTPDEKTFVFRGSLGLSFGDYSEKVLRMAGKFLDPRGKTTLTISFLSSPLRRLIIPIYPEVSIADTSKDLKKHLRAWAERIIGGTQIESRRHDIMMQIKKIHSFRENVIGLTERLFFRTRIMGDWSVHFDRSNVNAAFGYCPAIRDNFGILWNGDYTFCCTDFDARTSIGNFGSMSIRDYLSSDEVQKLVKGFDGFRVRHPYCKQCLGDRNILNALVKQFGSICYFKFLKNLK